MIFTYNENLGYGYVDNTKFTEKPGLGFEYDWLYVDDNNALYSNNYKSDIPKAIKPEFLKKIKETYDKIKTNKISNNELELLFDNSSSISIQKD